jgi:DNA sulfur modification protein DndD
MYSRYINTTKELDEVRSQVLATERSIGKNESEIQSMMSRQGQYKEIVNKLNGINQYIDKLEQFKSYLRDSKILTLQEKTFEMYQLLSHREGCSSILINPNSFEIKVQDINGSEIDKKELSEGEKQVLAMSILWALSQTSNITFPMVIDTPLSKLDSHHRKNIVKHFYSSAADQVLILSTDTEIQGKLYDIMSHYTCKQMALTFSHEKQSTTIIENSYILSNA